MSKLKQANWVDQVIVGAIFAVIGVALLALFVRVAEPSTRKPKAAFTRHCDVAPLLASLTTNRFQDTLSAIAAATRGSDTRANTRLTGSAGFYRTEALIAESFRRAGLETVTQEFSVVVPETVLCEIVDADGRPLEGVTLYPFAPSGLTPQTLPDEGIRARLVALDEFSLSRLDGFDPERSIMMTTLGSAGGWMSLASVGVPAVIVYEDETSLKLRSSPDARGTWDWMLSTDEQPFPRFYARGAIAAHAGKDVTIRCKTRFVEKQARNIIGVLKGDGSNPDALVLTAYYDANSVVPELAPGGEEAIALASLLQLAEAFAPYAGKTARDVVFVALAGQGQAMAGACQMMTAAGETYGDDRRRARFEARKRDDIQKLAWAEKASALLADDAKWRRSDDGKGQTSVLSQWWRAEDPAFRAWMSKCVVTVAGEIALVPQERALQSRLAYLRVGSPIFRDGFDVMTATPEQIKADENQHPLLRAMRNDQIAADRAGNLVSMSLPRMADRSDFGEWGIREKLARYMDQVAAYHRQALKEAADSDAVRGIFKRYAKTFTINLLLNSGGSAGAKNIALLTGMPNVGPKVEPIGTLLANTLQDRVPRTGDQPSWSVIYWGKADASGSRASPNRSVGGPVRASMAWTLFGQLAFSVDNYAFKPEKIGTPENEIRPVAHGVPVSQLEVLAPVLLETAYGRFEFQKIPLDRKGHISEWRGYAFGTVGTGQMLPSHPMVANTFVRVVSGFQPSVTQTAGVHLYPPLAVNPYGFYHREAILSAGTRADAARYDDSGRVMYFKDAGLSAQGVFQTEAITGLMAASLNGARLVNIAMFRCSHVGFPDRSNPRTMRSFAGVSFLASQGYSAPSKMRTDGSGIFLSPDFRFNVGLLDGSPDNPQVQTYRAFMLNVDPDPAKRNVESDIQGRGYLAADTALIRFIHFDAAESMLFTHGRRLQLQKAYRMADERMLEFYERGHSWLDQARGDRAKFLNLDALLNAGRSLSYAINNHPVIRSRISQAVHGIIWYLGLLVPFVFFFEKLVFGFTDIRRQLLAMAAVFLVVFGLLRVMHPAFQMVRSSLMILIGFVMFLLTLIVMIMVAGKFKQNIKELRSKEGRVEGADINRSGVIGTAFMLGLNNMRRRKVRTSLTCITLILITFVMICFTSVSSDLVNIENVTGRTPWNGLQIQKRGFLPLTEGEVGNIRNLYARRYPVTVHSWLVSPLNPNALQNPEIEIDRAYPLGERIIKKRTKVSGSVMMEWREPMFSGLDKHLTANSRWFVRPPETKTEREAAVAAGYNSMPSVIVPDTVARALDISDDDLRLTNVVVEIRGEAYQVTGIIDAITLTEYVGMDGKSILPYDLNSIQALGTDQTGAAILPEDVRRLLGGDVIVVNKHPTPKNEQAKIMSCQIAFPKSPYTMPQIAGTLDPVDFRDQKRLVDDYLERVAEPAFYGVEGIAYYGSRIRAKTFEGVLQILIPIIIAALTVFSTMRGSVYERRGEIYVYNAVGIAPNHVFFMFMAEAAVYAVVGAMMGYLLSQGVGRALTALNLTRGMNMNYSSIETIYASLAIVCSVLLSTIIPARSAARLAAPSETREWKMPPIVNDALEFDLPFTFTPYDRVAVLSYMHRWLDAHGEGGAGQFFSSKPEVVLRPCSGDAAKVGAIPAVVATVWLKPYDLGVSQRVEVLLPTDAETQEFIARVRMVRLSGTTASWERTIKPFMSLLRKQFLNWRAATEQERSEMYAEAKTLIQNARAEGESHGG
ncbi:MAG: FtsX-like permease family protein [Lentisphaerae bacterium]|nr:FtsX-like permease family protein [Lentisphaerota bacterium]